MTTTIIGFPRIGENRELKFATEKFFRNEITEKDLLEEGKQIRKKHWLEMNESHLAQIPSNDFSFYDQILDTCFLFNLIPARLAAAKLSPLEKYFALARGYQGSLGDFKAWPMKKWFNTNYHYLVPQLAKETKIKLCGSKIFDEFREAKALGILTRPVLIGPFTLLKLAEFTDGTHYQDLVPDLLAVYTEIITKLGKHGAAWLQIDEPALVSDLDHEEQRFFKQLYETLLAKKGNLKILLQTYFGDVRDIYSELCKLPFDGIGLDFVEGRKTLELVQSGFPAYKTLFAGVVNGKNIWRNDYQKTIKLIKDTNVKNYVLSTSCSLLHVPYTTENESFSPEITAHFSFAKEKLSELCDLDNILQTDKNELLRKNQQLFQKARIKENSSLAETINSLKEENFVRTPAFSQRESLQKEIFGLPLLPTTTIGSFPQTREVKKWRAAFKNQKLSQQDYDDFLKKQIKDWINWQEEIGLDVLVHGEFERNDMVEYFGQHLEGYLFSRSAWVQSYGTRAVKPPIIWGDIIRKAPITVKWSTYAQSLTSKPVKGMLTGPVTILNWSFPREDLPLKISAFQLALAIQQEVLDLEKNGIKIIQIDEAALREKLPLRKSDWHADYLDWAIPAFRLTESKVRAETQIHTHMCYSEFTDIIPAIEQMDADVISFEASRSNLEILSALQREHFQTEVGPGVYDIHSPRIPSVAEIKETIRAILAKVPKEKIWINPDCGLKTRGIPETKASLANMTAAAEQIRKELYR